MPSLSEQTAGIANRAFAGRIPELDGFRAIAVWMVLGSHMILGWTLPEGAQQWIPKPVSFVLSKGWLGVDLFFVLSGLLITGLLLDARDGPRYFRNFYCKRVLRIMPLYFTVIAVTFLAYREPRLYFLLAALFMANFATAWGVGTPHGPGVFWSLAVEEHFYLAWPLVVRFLSRRHLALLSICIFALSPLLRGLAVVYGLDPERQIYPLSFFRFDGLALGALLAIWIRSSRCSTRSSLQLSGLMTALAVIITVGGLPFGVMGTKTVASTALRYTQVQLLFGSAILAALALAGTPWTAWLRTRFMRVSSDLSYCIYLIHLSVGDGYHWLLGRWHVDAGATLGPSGALIAQVLFVVGVTFGLAALSQKYLEGPCLRLKRYFI
jgi:peptidoglycan/LPS O-acetylase OafA/YrhL